NSCEASTMRLGFAIVLTMGCRQVLGLADPQPIGDAGADAPRDSVVGGSCSEKWLLGPAFANPIRLAVNANMSGKVFDPFVTANELSLYFSDGSDIYVAMRASLLDSFGPAVPETSLNDSIGSDR